MIKIVLIIAILMATACKNNADYKQCHDYYPEETQNGPMIYIPKGSFTKGRSIQASQEICNLVDNHEFCTEKSFISDAPPYEIYLDGYFIDKYEVSNSAYLACVNAGKCEYEDMRLLLEYPQFPVSKVTWIDAKKYCMWAGKELPTEAQWEKAAGYNDNRFFPWGNEFTCSYVKMMKCLNNIGETMTSPVGDYSKNISGYCIYDMAGNVSEWTRDLHYSRVLHENKNSGFFENLFGEYSVVKGGAVGCSASRCFISNRAVLYKIDKKSEVVGFRCVYEEK